MGNGEWEISEDSSERVCGALPIPHSQFSIPSPQVFWITMLGNAMLLFFACSDSRAAALRAIAR